MTTITEAIENIKQNVYALQALGKDALPDGFSLLMIARFPDEKEAIGGLVGSGLEIASLLAGAMKKSPEFKELILATAAAYQSATEKAEKPFTYATEPQN